MNRVLVWAHECDGDGQVRLADGRAQHLIRVLKLQPGDRFRAGVIDGPRGEALIESIESDAVVARLELEERVPARPRVDLILALPRPKVLGRLWPELSALGVGHLALTNAWRVERNYFDIHQLRLATYQARLIEGLQQAGDTRLPSVSVHKRLVPLLEDGLDPFGDAARLVAHPEGGVRVDDALAGAGERRVLVAIGPEGGWIDRELSLFDRCGFTRVGLGPRVLRSDTAAVALLSLIHDNLA